MDACSDVDANAGANGHGYPSANPDAYDDSYGNMDAYS